MPEQTVQQEFTVTTPARLRLSNVRGSVDVRPGEDSVISITAVKRPGTGDAERTQIEMSQEEDGAVTVKTRFGEGGWRFFSRREPCKVDYTVRMPPTCVLRIDCVSSDVTVQGLKGAFELKTVSGELTVRELGGRVKASTVSGDFIGEGLSGTAEISSVSGKLYLDRADLEEIEATSVSGDLELHLTLGAGPHRLKTVSGNALLVLPEGAGCSVEISSISGRLKVPVALTGGQKKRHGLVELLGGGPRLRFSSISGNLAVELSEQTAACEEEAPPAPVEVKPLAATAASSIEEQAPIQAKRPTPRTRLEVLDLIAQGVLSAEEGLASIKSLKRSA